MKSSVVCSWAREPAADLAFDRLIAITLPLQSYDLDKDSGQDSTAFPAIVSTFIDAVLSSEREDLLPGCEADEASPVLCQPTALPLVHSVINLAAPTTGSECTAPRHLLILIQKSRKWLLKGQMISRS